MCVIHPENNAVVQKTKEYDTRMNPPKEVGTGGLHALALIFPALCVCLPSLNIKVHLEENCFFLKCFSWTETTAAVQHAVKILRPITITSVLYVAYGLCEMPQSTAETANVLGFSNRKSEVKQRELG